MAGSSSNPTADNWVHSPGLTGHDKVGIQRQGLTSGSSSETYWLCDLGQVGTLSGLQFPITHLSLQISTLFCHSLCPRG